MDCGELQNLDFTEPRTVENQQNPTRLQILEIVHRPWFLDLNS